MNGCGIYHCFYFCICYNEYWWLFGCLALVDRPCHKHSNQTGIMKYVEWKMVQWLLRVWCLVVQRSLPMANGYENDPHFRTLANTEAEGMLLFMPHIRIYSPTPASPHTLGLYIFIWNIYLLQNENKWSIRSIWII